MQQSRRHQVEIPRTAIARYGSVERERGYSDAKVTVLGDYLSRHARDEPDEASRMRATHREALRSEPDPRSLPLAPRQNLVLASLTPEAFSEIAPHLELVALPQGWVVCEAGADIDHVYFPTSGIVSLVYELENGTSVEVALTGNDGLVGVQAVMGGGAATSRAVVRNSGHGYRLRVDVLNEKFERCPLLRQPLLRYAQALMAQTTQTAVCHCHHRLEQQFSRLLLLTLDRLPSNQMALTQDALADLLGVRRESITATAGKLQAAGLIRYHRGRITVMNRDRLEERVCECYGVVKGEIDRLLKPHDAPAPAPSPSDSRHPSHALPLASRASNDHARRAVPHGAPRMA